MGKVRDVLIHNGHPRARVNARARRALRRAIALLDAHGEKFLGGCPAGELSLVFLTGEALAGLHGEFMGDASETDVITFAAAAAAPPQQQFTVHSSQFTVGADEHGRVEAGVPTACGLGAGDLCSEFRVQSSELAMAGEICVSVDAAAAFAKRHGREVAEELLLYVVHGWLHLAGYDDLQPARRRVMRGAERRAMGILREAGVTGALCAQFKFGRVVRAV